MSRSYKKSPVVTDGSARNTHHSKKLAARRLRRSLNSSDELLQGSKYKKHTCSYNIHDYAFRLSWEDARREYEGDKVRYSRFMERYPTLEDYYRWWEKYYRRK